MVSWQEKKAHGSQEKQMQATNPKKLTSKLELDNIEHHTSSIKAAGYRQHTPTKRQQDEDYSTYTQ